MNLSENLKKIRKDNNLSQEALAEKLGVSRQSVSKWESGLAYPEMDKVLQLCEMFNLNIDELLNQNIKEVEKNKQSSFDVNKYINEFLNYVTKTVNMFSSMKFKDKIKCLFEQFVIIFLYVIAANIVGHLLSKVVSGLINFLPDQMYYGVYQILESVFFLGAICLGVLVVLHIFKTRYLDYYVVVDKEEEKEEVVSEEVKEEKNTNKEEKKELKRKEERVIIRDEKHSSYKFFTVIGRIVLFFIKLFVGFIGLNFCATLVGLVVLLVLSFLFIKTGLLWFGGFIGLIGAITITLIILNLIYSFIFNKKVKPFKLFVLFISALILGGVGIACIVIGVKDFRYINSFDENYMTKSEEVIKWDKTLIINDYNLDYVESNDKDIKLVFEYTPSCKVKPVIGNDHVLIVRYDCNTTRSMINYYLDTLNEKVIVDPDYMHVTLYTTKENINILKANRENYLKKMNEIEEKEYIKDLKNRINELEGELDKQHNCECEF